MDQRYKKIDQISQSFCLAKWLQVTIDLKHGTNHSCHHPQRHLIPEKLLEEGPGVLHNTPFKKRQRKMMLEGERPKECSYCWDIEDRAGRYQSDRYIKSTDPWAFPSLEKVSALPWNESVNPTYIEVMFDSKCNLSCSYCMADISTSIEKEMLEFGPYPVSDQQHRMSEHPSLEGEGENSFQKAFWRWLPTLNRDLKVLRITGGEPFLSPQNEKLLEFFDENPFPDLKLVVNSNLSLPESLIDKKFDRIEGLLLGKKIGSFELYTSLDGLGVQAAYIRSGLNHELFWSNIDRFFKRFPRQPIVIMCAFNILSCESIQQLLEKVLQYKASGRHLVLDMAYLKNPFYLRANLADQGLRESVEKAFSFIKSNTQEGKFSQHEYSKFETIYQWINFPVERNELLRGRRDFFAFVNEYDRRKGNSFLEVFPRYRSFFRVCEKIYKFTEADAKAAQSKS
jgi:organic radical activating enzyme